MTKKRGHLEEEKVQEREHESLTLAFIRVGGA